MARTKCIGIRQTLATLSPEAEVEHLAHECGGTIRPRRRVKGCVMVWTALLGFGAERERMMDGLVFDASTNESRASRWCRRRATTDSAGSGRGPPSQLAM